MARVVCVHGIGQQLETSETLHSIWAPAMVGGVRLGGAELSETDIVCAEYGSLFRKPGRKLAVGDEPIEATDLDHYERDLLMLLWQEAGKNDPRVIPPDASTLGTPMTVQRGLRALSNSRFFANVAERALLGNLRQVKRYMNDDQTREEINARVLSAVGPDTRLIVGHSLGSVVAYEVMSELPPDFHVSLVTLGSPLGIANLIFDRLRPPPSHTDPRGQWPRGCPYWANVADEADVVALVKDLRPLFGDAVESFVVDNDAHAHSIAPYLTAQLTGQAISRGMAAAERAA